MSDISDVLYRASAVAVGTVSYAQLSSYMSTHAKTWVERLCAGCAGVLIGAFPYYGGKTEGNLSVYARGEDYHITITALLEDACKELRKRYSQKIFVPMVDASPLPEVTVARLAGIGMIGAHGLIICPPYGSYVFLGCILTNLPLESAEHQSADCCRCGKCVAACPSGALKIENGISSFEAAHCMSRMTQCRGELSESDMERIAQLPTIWGCDLCQNVCPYNERPEITKIAALAGKKETAPYLSGLDTDELETLTEEKFCAKYQNRAFSWHGISPLRRNLDLHKKRDLLP